MTNAEKELVKGYREKGLSYNRISNTLGISINTVKTFCKRNGLGGIKSESEDFLSTCKYCKRIIKSTPGKKKKQFCSNQCRNKWWNNNKDSLNKKAFYIISCSYCGIIFDSYGNSRRKYCSHLCYISARFGGGSHECK